MAICPKCKKEITHLVNYVLMWRELRFRVEDGKPIHDERIGDIVLFEPIEEEYNCPECDALLFKAEHGKGVRLPKPVGSKELKKAEEQAKAFLEGRG